MVPTYSASSFHCFLLSIVQQHFADTFASKVGITADKFNITFSLFRFVIKKTPKAQESEEKNENYKKTSQENIKNSIAQKFFG